ncbi:hypothetical protein I7I50_07112 [Histoplasma capsulatum G186AR]|uniref:Uncharacterized protein n=1 Tax=Ajellomyces capsulatus TaxID=5037 RepID=A0A8H7Z0D9_AJECA|nr:hypothetical protein I7I52_09843 [Histoplasma capsulatum]QSS67900.1 hypothetical protein I7I50_07112 [Histoplasma capsulatum G186AR]
MPSYPSMYHLLNWNLISYYPCLLISRTFLDSGWMALMALFDSKRVAKGPKDPNSNVSSETTPWCFHRTVAWRRSDQ